ncbi:MAG: LacI family DNA-binding transcriptional regulator [Treponema sp.]|nr:LacI family DNA-binding transcriptional regulator [Treponema sp.]
MITLKDIAKECNVSFSTVSKALQDSSEISEEKKKLIQKKAEEMGYHPNIAARTLRTNKTFDIGVIFEDKTGSGLQHQYFAKIISGLQEIALENGYDITFTGNVLDNTFDYYKHTVGRNFDAVAILSADFSRDDIQKLIKSSIPTVTLDYMQDNSHFCVMSDNKQGMEELTEYAISMGHKKIALIYGEDTLVTGMRKTAFLETLKKHNISIPDNYMLQGLYHDPITSAQAANDLLSLTEPPTCIFFPDDYSALGGIRVLNAHKLVPGKDISIVGYDGILLTSMMIPALTTYEQNGEEIGQEIARALISQIQTKEQHNHQILVSGRLLKGSTVVKLN